MTLLKALPDPACQLCQARIIWAPYYREVLSAEATETTNLPQSG